MWTKERVLEIYQEYQESKCTQKEIGEKYSFSAAYHFKKHGLTNRNFNTLRTNRKKLLWDGKEITNEKEAYILGFWYADGYITYQDQACIKLKDSESDRKLLEDIRDYICPEQELKKDKNSLVLKISSNSFCLNLINLGCLYEKTYKELNIPEMDESLLRHFIRGYFDGDGTVFFDRKYLKSNISSINKNFLEKIKKILDDNNIENRINIEKRKGKKMKKPLSDEYSITQKDMYRLYVSKRDALEKFKKFLYDDATIFLSRKKNVFYKDNIELTK